MDLGFSAPSTGGTGRDGPSTGGDTTGSGRPTPTVGGRDWLSLDTTSSGHRDAHPNLGPSPQNGGSPGYRCRARDGRGSRFPGIGLSIAPLSSCMVGAARIQPGFTGAHVDPAPGSGEANTSLDRPLPLEFANRSFAPVQRRADHVSCVDSLPARRIGARCENRARFRQCLVDEIGHIPRTPRPASSSRRQGSQRNPRHEEAACRATRGLRPTAVGTRGASCTFGSRRWSAASAAGRRWWHRLGGARRLRCRRQRPSNRSAFPALSRFR